MSTTSDEDLADRMRQDRAAAEENARAHLSGQDRVRAEHDSRVADARRDHQQAVADAEAVVDAREHAAAAARVQANHAENAVKRAQGDVVRIERVHAGIDWLARQARGDIARLLVEKSRTFAVGPKMTDAEPLAALYLLANPDLGFVDFLHGQVSDVAVPAHGLSAETDEEHAVRVAELRAEARRLDALASEAEEHARQATRELTETKNWRRS